MTNEHEVEGSSGLYLSALDVKTCPAARHKYSIGMALDLCRAQVYLRSACQTLRLLSKKIAKS